MPEARSKSPPEAFLDIVADMWTEPFWRATEGHVLVAPKCRACGQFRMPPTPFCPNCRSQQIEWVPLSGRGTVYSYTVVTRAITEEMESCIPYVPAVITLPDAGGVRLISNIVGARLSDIHIDAPVRVVWNDRPGGHAIPQFELVRNGPSGALGLTAT